MSKRRKSDIGGYQQGQVMPRLSPALHKVIAQLPPNERVAVEQYEHHNKHTKKRKGETSDEDIQQIRNLQREGLPKMKVRRMFPHVGDTSFHNIWEGTTAAWIVAKEPPK